MEHDGDTGVSYFQPLTEDSVVRVLTQTELESALVTPSSIFEAPRDIVDQVRLPRSVKIELLKRWELEARALQRAEDESMTGGEPTRLDDVNRALADLDPLNSAGDDFGRIATKI
jgi:hypothetical protein